MSVIKTISWP